MVGRFVAFFVVFIGAALLFFSGCSKNDKLSPSEEWVGESKKVRVLSTTAMVGDLVKQVGGKRIVHISLIQGEMDPHSYELVKGDEEKISLATVVFYNGLGLEHGASLRYHIEHHPCAIALGDEIRRAKPQAILTMDSQVDPHLWMDISLWMEAIDPIVKALSLADPSGEQEYRENGQMLRKEMEAVHKQLSHDLSQISADQRYLVTSHNAFHYFVRSYLGEKDDGENRYAAPEGLAPDGQLASTDIQNVISYLLAKNVHVLFPESNVSRDALRKIVSAAREKGHEARISRKPLYSDAMGAQGSSADSYLKMMQHNAQVLLEEWDGPRP